MRFDRERRGEPRLAHPVAADQRHQRAGALGGPPPAHLQPAQLAVAADQRRRARGVELARQLGDDRHDVERRVLAQDRLVQPPQLGPRLDADLLDERAPRVPVGLQRLGLTAAPIQRQHPQAMQPLAQRVLGQQRLDLADDRLMAAGGEVRVQSQLLRRQPQLLEPPDLRRRERLVGQVRQRVAAEQGQRLMRRAAPVATRLRRRAVRGGAHRRARDRCATHSRAHA